MLKSNLLIAELLVISVLVTLCTSAPKNSKVLGPILPKNLIKKIYKLNPRIIGGSEATPHAYPYQAFLEIYSFTTGWYCGGSLISENYVLTSGECGFGGVEAYVTLGAHRPLDENEYHFKVSSKSITVHELYNAENMVNDIAVLELSIPAELSDAIQPISLPESNDNDYVDYSAVTTGWGVTEPHEKVLSEVLKYLDLTIIENKSCEVYFGSLPSSKVCAVDNVNKGNLCDGDDGGPLVADNVLVGVAAYGTPFCLGGYPTVFTRTSSFIDWIANHTDLSNIRNL